MTKKTKPLFTHLDDKDEIKTIELADLSRFQLNDMQAAWEFFPSDYAIAAEGLLAASQDLNSAKNECELLEQKLYNQFRAEADTTGAKVTEKSLASRISVQPNVVAARSLVEAASNNLERYKQALKVLDKKERAMEIVSRFQIKELGSLGRS